jgi:hypothetical protein
VRWTESIRYLTGKGAPTFEELGPGNMLTRRITDIQRTATPLVQLVTIKCSISGSHSGRVSHDLGHGFHGPVERMCMLIPFSNELFNLGSQLIFRCKVDDS